jgi:von Willebrand factor type A domain
MVTVPERARRLPRLPGSRRPAIPLADSAALRGAVRRTTWIRLGLAGALLLLTAFAVWRATTLNPRPLAFLDRHTTTVVVLDESKSVSSDAYRRIATLIRALSDANAPVGLVVFSDTAYEMMPPGSSGSELRPLLRFFTKAQSGETNLDPDTSFPASPWQDVFSGGTKISAGIDLAQSIIHRDRVKYATIVLVSDLETAGDDQPALADSLLSVTHDPRIRMKVLPLFPVDIDMQFFRKYLPASAFISGTQVQVAAARGPRQRLLVANPWPFVLVGALLMVALAANELLCGRIVLASPKEAAA